MTEPRPEDAPEAGDVPMSVLGVRVELPEQHHVILLVDPPGRIMVPLWVGAPEAAAAALALEGVSAPRPLTHELLLSTVAALGAEVVRVRLTEVRNDVVHGELREVDEEALAIETEWTFVAGLVPCEGLTAADLAAHPHVGALMWGAEDLVASMGGTSSRTLDGAYRQTVAHARSTVLLAAAAHGAAAGQQRRRRHLQRGGEPVARAQGGVGHLGVVVVALQIRDQRARHARQLRQARLAQPPHEPDGAHALPQPECVARPVRLRQYFPHGLSPVYVGAPQSGQPVTPRNVARD